MPARVEALDDVVLKPFAVKIGAYLDGAGADAVIVRPDRYVFGTGNAHELMRTWQAAVVA